MNTLRSLAAFGLVVFTMWAFSTTQTLGAAPTCPCASERETLLTAMLRARFPLATDGREGAICDTHPMALPPNPVLEARAELPPSPVLPDGLALFAEIEVATGIGSCDWRAVGGVQPSPFLDRAAAWSCIRVQAAACRALGYKSR